ncbi:MAG TPA: acyl-ACP--UDP-N-acetylglucosamine O-acyltransferase [Oculatellaceae cyanobacterium]|jgi:UDP-N-acetylglucosamine acyltransferase
MTIHPSAVVDPSAELGVNVEVGPFSYIGPHCKVGDNSRIGPNAVLEEYVTLGRNCQVSPGAVLGGKPQDMAFKGEVSYVTVGDNARIREGVTIHRASGENQTTSVGNDCMLMAYVHLGHNCKLGNGVIIANNTQMAGYVEVDDYAFISGTCVFHQFVKIGKLAMIGGFSGSRQDIPPFALVYGAPVSIYGINKVGLRRRGYDLNARTRLKKAYQLLFFSGMNTNQALAAIADEFGTEDAAVNELVRFVQNSSRGICKAKAKKGQPQEVADEPELAEML